MGIYRDRQKNVRRGAWTRARTDILLHRDTQAQPRCEDVLTTFWGDEIRGGEKNFHPTISHIRKASNAGTDPQNFIIFRDGVIMNPEFSISSWNN